MERTEVLELNGSAEALSSMQCVRSSPPSRRSRIEVGVLILPVLTVLYRVPNSTFAVDASSRNGR
jgi:hypothetical protein